jgi:hypothetical protein
MKTAAIFASVALAGFAAAQLDQLPTCAQDCASQFLAGGIGDCGTDPKCICENESFIGDIACCLAKPGACDEEDQSSAVHFASQICAAQGVSVPSAVSCSTTAGSDATTTSGGSPATNSAEETGASDAAESTNTDDAASRPRETGMAAAVMGGLAVAVAML